MIVNQTKLELNAPIVPNQGLGGLTLRTSVIEIQDLFIGLGVTKPGSFEMVVPFEAMYHFGKGEINAAVDIRNGKIYRLAACAGYKGFLFGKIFVGMKVKDAIALEPNLYYDEAEEVILCKGAQGLAIDVAESDPPPELVPEMAIYAINVFAEETRTMQGQEGRW